MQKVLFIFNQLLTDELASGGDIKSFNIYKRTLQDSTLDASVMAPSISDKTFKGSIGYAVGNTYIEKIISPSYVPFILVLYLARTLESLKYVKSMKPDAKPMFIYSTGDFFCNVVPAFLLKRKCTNARWGACVFHINENPFKRQSNYFLRGLVSFLVQRFSFALIKHGADYIFVLNNGMKETLESLGFKNKIVVSKAGLDTKDLLNRYSSTGSTKNFATKKDALVFFNRVNPTKGIFDLPAIFSEVLKEHPHYKLHMIGHISQDMKTKLSSMFKEYKCLDNVVIHGFIADKNEALTIVSESKVFLQPSYEEGWSLVLFEAIMCRTIPVTYDLPIYKEIFDENINSVTTGNTKAFANTILEILLWDMQQYDNKSNALINIARRYDWDNVYLLEKECIKNETN